MTIRAVVSVALAAALLAVSLPAVDRARIQHADARIAGEVDRLETVARSLARENDLVDHGPPASAGVTLHLPTQSWGASDVVGFRIRPPGATRDVSWRIRGGEQHARRLSGVTVAGPPTGLVLRDGGRHRLVLELRRRGGDRTVVVRRPNGSAGTS